MKSVLCGDANHRLIALDLLQCLDQKELTTKHVRREKALAYLLESLTGSPNYIRRSKEEVEGLLVLIGQLQANVKTEEAKIGYQRTEKRLRYMLDHPQQCLGNQKNECHACGELYEGGNHVCTNQASRMKDIVMTRDDTVIL